MRNSGSGPTISVPAIAVNHLAAGDSIEEVLTPGLITTPQIAHYLAVNVKAESLWPLDEPHSGFFRRVTAFAVITPLAAGDQIIPIRMAAAGSWKDMVQGQFRRSEDMSAVLTGIMVA